MALQRPPTRPGAVHVRAGADSGHGRLQPGPLTARETPGSADRALADVSDRTQLLLQIHEGVTFQTTGFKFKTTTGHPALHSSAASVQNSRAGHGSSDRPF